MKQLQNECNYKTVGPTPLFCTKRPLAGNLYCSPSPPLLCSCYLIPDPKVVRTWCVFKILTSKSASGHNAVDIFSISAAKSALELRCFACFDFDMCLALQRRAHFSNSAPRLRCFAHFDLQILFALQRRAIFHLSSLQMAPHPPL